MGNEQKKNLETRFIRKPFITSAKMIVCVKPRLLTSQSKGFLRLRGVKECKCIHLSIDLMSKLG